MHISPQILRLALLRIFAEAGVGAGEKLSFGEVSARWPQTGLRGSDLRDAVRELLDSGDLIGSGGDEALSLALSPETQRSVREPHGVLQMASFDEEATLFMARHRRKSGRLTEMRQRAEDHRVGA